MSAMIGHGDDTGAVVGALRAIGSIWGVVARDSGRGEGEGPGEGEENGGGSAFSIFGAGAGAGTGMEPARPFRVPARASMFRKRPGVGACLGDG